LGCLILLHDFKPATGHLLFPSPWAILDPMKTRDTISSEGYRPCMSNLRGRLVA
jgi:hypothetical protein